MFLYRDKYTKEYNLINSKQSEHYSRFEINLTFKENFTVSLNCAKAGERFWIHIKSLN